MAMRPIPGFEGLYSVTPDGGVWSHPRMKRHSEGVAYSMPGRWLKPMNTPYGYRFVALSKDGRAKHFPVHRLVAIAWIENPQQKPEVNHIDGCKTNNRVGNLEWCTSSENNLHAYRTGLKIISHKQRIRTASMGRATRRLTIEQAGEIRAMVQAGNQRKRVASLFGVTRSCITGICNGTLYQPEQELQHEV